MWGSLAALLACVSLAQAQSPSDFRFVDARTLGIHGQGFPPSSLASPYDRLPAAAQSVVREAVWSLSTNSAGLFLQFVSNTSAVAVNVTYTSASFSMWHFPSTGVSGLDLYLFDAGNATWRWVGTSQTYTAPVSFSVLVQDLPAGEHLFRLHLPTYNSPSSLGVGVDPTASLNPDPNFPKRAPVVHYGTSICQGAVATRPGQAYTNIVARRLNREVLNFGFSGNGLMELSVAQFLVQAQTNGLPPAAFIIDCNPNMNASLVTARTVPLVQYIRKAFPTTPIVLAEGTEYGSAWLNTSVFQFQSAIRAALHTEYQALLAQGVPNLHYVSQDDLFDAARHLNSPTVDGTHPTDLGMYNVATFWSTFLPTILPADDAVLPPANNRALAAGPLAPELSAADRAVRARNLAHLLPTTLEFERALPLRLASPDRRYTLAVPSDGASPSSTGCPIARLLESTPRILDSASSSPSSSAARSPLASVMWASWESLHVSGRAFEPSVLPSPYSRLPSTAQATVRPPVWSYSLFSTGMRVAFVTNSTAIAVNFTLGEPAYDLFNVPLSNVNGLDLFRWDDEAQTYRFVNTVSSFPTGDIVFTLYDDLPVSATPVRYLIHLPSRNYPTVGSIGVLAGSVLLPDTAFPASTKAPLVWYGTSILQAGAVARPGNAFSQILARGLDREIFNFGFAGNGEMELSVAAFLTQIPNPAAFLIDCNWNMNATSINASAVPLVHFLRQSHPTTPIVLVEGTPGGDDWLGTGAAAFHAAERAALRAAYDTLVAGGDTHLAYVTTDSLFTPPIAGSDAFTNPTVEGTHPSDLGHQEVADFYLTFLPTIVGS